MPYPATGLPFGWLFKSDTASIPLGAVLPKDKQPLFSGEDRTGAVSLWKNQRIHSVPFGTGRLNQFPALVGEKIESMIRRFLI